MGSFDLVPLPLEEMESLVLLPRLHSLEVVVTRRVMGCRKTALIVCRPPSTFPASPLAGPSNVHFDL